MHTRLKTLFTGAALAGATLALTMFAVSQANAGAAGSMADKAVQHPGVDTATGLVELAGYRRYRRYGDSGRYYDSRRYDYDRYDRDYVDGPYVRRYGRGDIDVDAPYARVQRDRGGVYVRAPYVNIYIPRY